MFNHRKALTFIFLLFVLALAACGPTATTAPTQPPATVQPTTPPTRPPATDVPPTVVPTPAPTTPPTVVITDPAELMKRCQITGYPTYQDKANNLCFAYSPRYKLVTNSTGQPEIQGPRTDPKNQVVLGVEVKSVPAGSSRFNSTSLPARHPIPRACARSDE